MVLVGATGAQGIQGVPGNDGVVGAQGPIGLTGATGLQGAQGAQGAQGIQGPAGVDGDDGQDGQDGPPGQDGAVGATGAQGIQGVPGNDGAVGATGPIGLTGPAGANGIDGTNGTNGVDGIDGIDAVVDYDSLANLISVDSTFITNVGVGMGGGGCDFAFPEGLSGDIITYDLSTASGGQGPYTVPSGKNLYILNFQKTQTAYGIEVNGKSVWEGASNYSTYGALNNPVILNSGDIIQLTSPGANNATFNGYLVDESATINPLTYDLSTASGGQGPYTVPSGKNLYILNFQKTQTAYGIEVNGKSVWEGASNYSTYGVLNNLVILNSGDIIQLTSPGANNATFNGYLADENYFAGCGGGSSSSSTSSLDSTTIANMIAAAGGGVSFGDFISINTNTESQAISDGFLYGKFHLTNVSTIDIFCDTFSGNTSSRGYFSSNPYGGNYLRDGSFNIPIKKNEYYSFNNTGNSSIYDAYFVPLDSDGGSSSNSGPTFINPILITTTLCGSGGYLTDSIHINIDSILGQNVSSLIIHSVFVGTDGPTSNINLEVNSWNGVFTTPVLSLATQFDGLGYAIKVSDVNNQVIIPNSNSGIISLVINGQAITNGTHNCNSVTGNIKIVGYY